MKMFNKWPMLLAFAMVLAGAQLITAASAHAQSTYFTSRGCVNCHSTPVTATCAGCHQHSGTLAATLNKTTPYAPGETVTVTMTASGARSGWIGARLYNQSGMEIARSTGNQSGMGGSTLYPAILSAPAPTTAGTYTWRMAYMGNVNGTGTGDVHGEKSVNVTVNVAAPADTAAPTVSAFTLPATATSLTVPVSSFTASDNVGVTGYLVTTSAAAPAASAAGWSATAPTSVTAPAAGTVTFYAWAKDAAGNVSASRSATVVITIAPEVDTVNPVLIISTLADGTVTNNPTLNVSGNATDNVGLRSVTVNGSLVQPDASGNFSTAVALVSGANTITVIATDTAGNTTTVSRTVTYVANISQLEITTPADNLVSSQGTLVVEGITSENSTVTVTVNGGSPQVASLNGNVFTATVYLRSGLNTIAIKSVDPSGAISNAKRTVIYDNSNPTVAITEPGEDKTVSDQSITIKGRVADTISKVTVKITMDANVYTPVVREGRFEQRITFTVPKQYTIVATATDEAGNQVSVSRNVIYRGEGDGESYDEDDREEDDDYRDSRISLSKPQLNAEVDGRNLAVAWTPVAGATGYRLYYAPAPYTGPESIGSLDMGSATDFDITLWRGAAYLIAVEAYNASGTSGYSNIETIAIR